MGNYSQKINRRVLTRGKKKGYCVICREYGSLSREHVVPQGCGNVSDKIVLLASDYFNSPEQLKGNRSQGGIHFKTVCGYCNSLLGSKYDKELIKFTKDVEQYINSLTYGFEFNKTTYTSYKTVKIAKAIIGHLLAANSVNDTSHSEPLGGAYNQLARFVLDENLPLPDDISIYYWLYPYRPIKMLRSIGIININDPSQQVIGDILKFYPVAFLVSFGNAKPSTKYGLTQLPLESNQSIDDVRGLKMTYNAPLRADFPEAPSNNEVLLVSDQYCTVAIDVN